MYSAISGGEVEEDKAGRGEGKEEAEANTAHAPVATAPRSAPPPRQVSGPARAVFEARQPPAGRAPLEARGGAVRAPRGGADAAVLGDRGRRHGGHLPTGLGAGVAVLLVAVQVDRLREQGAD